MVKSLPDAHDVLTHLNSITLISRGISYVLGLKSLVAISQVCAILQLYAKAFY